MPCIDLLKIERHFQVKENIYFLVLNKSIKFAANNNGKDWASFLKPRTKQNKMANRRDDVFVMTPPESGSSNATPSESTQGDSKKTPNKQKKHRRGLLLAEVDALFVGTDGILYLMPKKWLIK